MAKTPKRPRRTAPGSQDEQQHRADGGRRQQQDARADQKPLRRAHLVDVVQNFGHFGGHIRAGLGIVLGVDVHGVGLLAFEQIVGGNAENFAQADDLLAVRQRLPGFP